MTTTAQPTKLARAAAGTPARIEPSKLGKALSGAKVREPWTIPRIGLAVEITLVPYSDQERIEAEVHDRMRDRKLDYGLHTEAVYDTARAVRWFAVAFLEPGTDTPIGTVTDWEALDGDVISACWRKMADVRAAYDPVSVALTQDELEQIAQAVKKKDPTLLRFFGVAALASYLLCTADPQSNSATPTFGPSGSSPAS